MTRFSNALAMAVFGLLVATPLCAGPARGDQIQANQPPKARLEHRPKDVVHGLDPAIQLRHQLRDATNKGLIGIVSEGTDETVDMAVALASEHDAVRLLPVAGADASQNVKDVIFARGIDFGIVPTDVLGEIRRNPPFPRVEKYLQYVTKLYDQQVHLLTGPDIQSVTDLAGKTVNFGRRDSGTYITATNIFKALGVEPDIVVLPHPRALDQLRRGELSAMVYVGTEPARMFQDIRPDERLHFLSITGNVPTDYSAGSIAAEDYPELVSKDAPVNTVEVGTVLVAYNWPDKSERSGRVNRFVQAFFTHLNDIKASHPKWHDFDVTSSVSGWTRFPAAEQWLKKASLIPEPSRATIDLDIKQRESLFRDFAAREALFQAFAEYQKAHRPVDFAAREALFQAFAEYQKAQRSVILAYHDVH
jgi:TRAP-type uncharacterized transport system substrate-binding protein